MGNNRNGSGQRIKTICSSKSIDEISLYSRAKLVLEVYRDVCWNTADYANMLREEALCDYAVCTSDLDAAFVYLENFAPDEKKDRFAARVQSLFEVKWMIEIVDHAISKVHSFPIMGDMYCSILTAYYLSMGEINALRPEDIDFKNHVIHVRGTISSGANGRTYRSDTTKTRAGMRDVPMNSLVIPVLEQALEEMKPNPGGTVFYDHIRGGLVTTTQVCTAFRMHCERIGISYYGQHSLRHTFATRCIEAGIQPVVLKTWLGHTNIHVTLDTYSDVFDSLNYKSISMFEEHLKGK